nr:MAG TPA: hypothetical protein [Bacteriophage sp.]
MLSNDSARMSWRGDKEKESPHELKRIGSLF